MVYLLAMLRGFFGSTTFQPLASGERLGRLRLSSFSDQGLSDQRWELAAASLDHDRLAELERDLRHLRLARRPTRSSGRGSLLEIQIETSDGRRRKGVFHTSELTSDVTSLVRCVQQLAP